MILCHWQFDSSEFIAYLEFRNVRADCPQKNQLFLVRGLFVFGVLALLVGRQKEHPTCKKLSDEMLTGAKCK